MKKTKTKGLYIDAKESRNIAKENLRTIKALKKKRASYKPEDYITEMRDPANIVEFDDLHTYFFTDNGVVKAVNGVSFDIPQGATVGVVGESGCGKSVTSLSLMHRGRQHPFPYHGEKAGRLGAPPRSRAGLGRQYRRRRERTAEDGRREGKIRQAPDESDL